jgi:hypothetical protein
VKILVITGDITHQADYKVMIKVTMLDEPANDYLEIWSGVLRQGTVRQKPQKKPKPTRRVGPMESVPLLLS